MFNKYLEWLQQRGLAWFYGVTLGGGLALCLATGWLWWHFSYLNPQTTFWGAVNNNLITVGVTKQVIGNDSSGQLNETDQISLGAHNFVSSTATVQQAGSGSAQSTVVSQTVGTPVADFARYTSIQTNQQAANGKALDFKPILGQWSQQDLGGTATVSGSFANAILGIIPLAHLNASQRQQVVGNLRHDNTYNIDFTKVQKKYIKGRLVYLYAAAVAPDKYVAMLKQVDGLSGLNQLKNLDPTQYQGGQPIQVTIGVDAWAHQLASVDYTANNRQETYDGWGILRSENLPTSTMSRADLQAKLNAILSGQ